MCEGKSAGAITAKVHLQVKGGQQQRMQQVSSGARGQAGAWQLWDHHRNVACVMSGLVLLPRVYVAG